MWYPLTAGVTGLIGATFLYTWWTGGLPDGESRIVFMMAAICLISSVNFLAKLFGFNLLSWGGRPTRSDGSSWREGFSDDGDGGD